MEDGKSELLWNEDLADLAIEHSEYMDKTGDFNHSSLGYLENIIESSNGYLSGHDVVTPWKNSSGHLVSMLNDDIHSGAVGVVGRYATFLAE